MLTEMGVIQTKKKKKTIFSMINYNWNFNGESSIDVVNVFDVHN